jgi:hypothetical protein
MNECLFSFLLVSHFKFSVLVWTSTAPGWTVSPLPQIEWVSLIQGFLTFFLLMGLNKMHDNFWPKRSHGNSSQLWDLLVIIQGNFSWMSDASHVRYFIYSASLNCTDRSCSSRIYRFISHTVPSSETFFLPISPLLDNNKNSKYLPCTRHYTKMYM